MKCQICGEDKELLEHHVSYTNRGGLYPIEIVVDICMDCHHKIHNRDGFHDELDPLGVGAEIKYENLLLKLFDTCDDIESFIDVKKTDAKYKIHMEDGEWKMAKVFLDNFPDYTKRPPKR